jgi:tripartite-type tricarboxylate transporter receptor subunit TctC
MAWRGWSLRAGDAGPERDGKPSRRRLASPAIWWRTRRRLHTLLFGTSSLAILPATTGARAVDAEQAFAPVSILTTQPLLIAAHPSFKGSNFADVVRMAKEQPDTIAFSTSGIGGAGHLAAAWAMTRANIKLVHVPYTATRALVDLLSGEVPLAFSLPGTVLPR